MQRRIFIAINLSENAKKELQKYQREWVDLPVRLTKKDNLHFTILFIGYVNDERMVEVCRNIREIAKKHQPFELNFNKICFGPPGKSPRLIWLEGEKSEELVSLKRDIEKIMIVKENDEHVLADIERELKIFIPHITLARIRQIEWKKIAASPLINKKVSIIVQVSGFEVMESELKKGGVEYTILESTALTG